MNKRGTTIMVIGAVLILGALALVGYNAWEEERASSSVKDILPKIEQMISNENTTPATNKEMATVTVDGNTYIGVLTIPSIGIELPVMSSWSYPLLKIAPCRYSGSLSGEALVIAGHNYAGHFGNLINMAAGDYVYFTDVNGFVYEFIMVESEPLQKTQIQEMTSDDWDLTLFTCDYRGRLRIAVRCRLNSA
jgi:sortase A